MAGVYHIGARGRNGKSSLARWPRAVACPGLPQTRTCIFDAYGSSDHGLAAFATRCCFVDTVLEFRCIRRLSQQRFHNPTPRFPPRGPGGPVPALPRYYQGATTCCRPLRRAWFPSLGATTRRALGSAPAVSKRNHGGPGVLCVRPLPEGRLDPVETTASPKFLENLHCAYARFFDSGVTARSSP